jgi:hypothetical protein
LREWEFQTSEPTRWSELRAHVPEVLQYVTIKQGALASEVSEAESFSWRLPALADTMAAEQLNLRIISRRWTMRNVPALRANPFMALPEDCRTKVRFELADPAELNTWEKLAAELINSESFGMQMERHHILRQQLAALVAGISEAEQKMRAIYDYVRTTMSWNGEYGLCAADLGRAFQARRANGLEMALMLTAMLRFAGLEAHPVLISTREHGKLLQSWVNLAQFNHALTHVKINEREYLLEATDPLRPYNLLPVAALNEIGWLVEKKNPRWVNIVNSGSYSNQTTVYAKLAADGSVSGWFQSKDVDYCALFNRHALRFKKQDEYIRERWLNDLTGARLDSFIMNDQEVAGAPLFTKVGFAGTKHAPITGDHIYFNPIFFSRQKENPLKLPECPYAVDFAYGAKLIYTLNLILPEGYIVEEAPRNLKVSLPNDDGEFRRLVQVDGNLLLLTSQIVIRKTRFAPEEYPGLREFYDRIVAAHAEPIVLKREPMRLAESVALK